MLEIKPRKAKQLLYIFWLNYIINCLFNAQTWIKKNRRHRLLPIRILSLSQTIPFPPSHSSPHCQTKITLGTNAGWRWQVSELYNAKSPPNNTPQRQDINHIIFLFGKYFYWIFSSQFFLKEPRGNAAICLLICFRRNWLTIIVLYQISDCLAWNIFNIYFVLKRLRIVQQIEREKVRTCVDKVWPWLQPSSSQWLLCK